MKKNTFYTLEKCKQTAKYLFGDNFSESGNEPNKYCIDGYNFCKRLESTALSTVIVCENFKELSAFLEGFVLQKQGLIEFDITV